jgi:hypothetical protein
MHLHFHGAKYTCETWTVITQLRPLQHNPSVEGDVGTSNPIQHYDLHDQLAALAAGKLWWDHLHVSACAAGNAPPRASTH